MSTLIEPSELASRIDEPGLRVCDLRWYLAEPSRGRKEYEQAHIPGAVFVDLDTDLAAPSGPGRHPLPTPRQFGLTLGRLGIDRDTFVVAYDSSGGGIASRLWWMLRAVGHPAVAVLDGGFQAWVEEGHPLESAPPEVTPAEYPIELDRWPGVVAAEAVHHRLGAVPIVDARAGERFRGEVEPIDARPGHIPGAVNRPHAANLAADGRFLPREELRERYVEVAGDETIVYCGSGVTACQDILAMVHSGLPQPLLYEGSWSDWASRSELPAETGRG